MSLSDKRDLGCRLFQHTENGSVTSGILLRRQPASFFLNFVVSKHSKEQTISSMDYY